MKRAIIFDNNNKKLIYLDTQKELTDEEVKAYCEMYKKENEFLPFFLEELINDKEK